MDAHPAYLAPATLRRESRANHIADEARENNRRIRTILQTALSELQRCDLGGYSMIPGYDLDDLTNALMEMLPRFDHVAEEMLADWARGEVV